MGSRKPHVVCVPCPTQGHVNPFMRLAKLLHSMGFHVTFVHTEFNYTRLVRSGGPDSVAGLPDFRFETIPDGLPSSGFDVNQDILSLCDAIRKNLFAPFVELLKKLNSSSSSPDGVPPVSCIISDGLMSFGIRVGEMLGIPQVQFWTASACSFMGYLHFSELQRRGILPHEDESFFSENGSGNEPVDWIPGLSNIRLKDIPSFVGTTNDELMVDFTRTEAENCLNSSAILFNTFEELEHEVLEAIASTKFPSSRIYSIGPLHLLEGRIPEGKSKSIRSSLRIEDSACIEWLDKRDPSSVVYVNYGSLAVVSEKHLQEFAWGLARSKQPFLWIIRSDVLMGDSVALPRVFIEETKDRGFVASWCRQEQVLSHPAVGAFLTHCGWNSMLETVSCGVPVICWPYFGDQHTNRRYACTKWGMGLELGQEVKREEIESAVKEMMQGDQGRTMRQNAVEWKNKAEEATDVGGLSYQNFDRFIMEALSSGLQRVLLELNKEPQITASCFIRIKSPKSLHRVLFASL